MRALQLGLILWAALPAEAFNSTFVGFDGEQHHNPVKWERSRLRHFLGLRDHPHHAVVTSAPVIHHGLHMLNHQVQRMGPLKRKTLKPFGGAHHFRRMNHSSSSNETASPIATYAVEGAPNKGWDAIKVARADMCVDMLRKHGVDFTDNKDKCMAFMDKTCRVPEGRGANSIKRPSGEGVCQEWYDLLNAARSGAAATAPSPAAYASPASAGPPPGGISGNRDPSWNRMDEGQALPEQGYEGELVAHDNMKTQTSDWHAEYGPRAIGHQSYEAICAEYPDNTWCKLRGYHSKKPTPKSAASRLQALGLTLVAPLLVSLCW